MRWEALAACALMGCGRIGFDPASGTAGDAGNVVGRQCQAIKIEGYDFGVTGASDLAVARLPDGFAVGAVFPPQSTFWGMHLDANLVPDAPTPHHSSPTAGLDGLYVSGDLRWDGVQLIGSLSSANDFQLKKFPTDMVEFSYASKFSGRATEASSARSGAAQFSTWFEGGVLRFMQLTAAGEGDGAVRTADTSTASIVSASTAGADVSVVALGLDDGSCRVVSIGADLTSIGRSLRAQCASPHVVRLGDQFTVAYTRGVMIAMSIVEATPPPLQISVGGERDLVVGSRPRLVSFGAESWVAYVDAGSLQLGFIGEVFEQVAIAGLPAALPDAFEVTDGHVFATYGSTLWAITCQ